MVTGKPTLLLTASVGTALCVLMAWLFAREVEKRERNLLTTKLHDLTRLNAKLTEKEIEYSLEMIKRMGDRLNQEKQSII